MPDGWNVFEELCVFRVVGGLQLQARRAGNVRVAQGESSGPVCWRWWVRAAWRMASSVQPAVAGSDPKGSVMPVKTQEGRELPLEGQAGQLPGRAAYVVTGPTVSGARAWPRAPLCLRF